MSRPGVMQLPTYRFNPYQRLLGAALEAEGFEVTVVGSYPQRYPIIGAWRASGRPGIVHLHWIHDFIGAGSGSTPSRRVVLWFDAQLRMLKALGVRLVWTVHNLQRHDSDDDQLERDATRRLIERADAVIVHCEFARDGLVERFSPSSAARARIHVIPHGSYVEHYPVDLDAAEARERLGLPLGGRVFSFVGAVRGYKGVGELLTAFLELDGTGPDDRLVIAGKPLPGRLGKELTATAGDDPRIVLRLERQTEEDLSAVIRASDAVVIPFRDILTSGSAILALSHGRPVIAPAMGCLPESIPAEASFLYPPAAPDGLSTAMRAALTADLAAMGEAALADARRLDWATIGRATAKLYRGD